MNEMTAQIIMDYMSHYGAIAIFVIVLLEYMNMPGFPAGVIMPVAGIWAARGELNFFTTMIVTVAAGLVGSLLLYALGRFGGEVFLNKYYKKFPKHKEIIENKMEFLRRKGSMGVFVSKLLPAVRTLISIPAGTIKMDIRRYVISSTLGIIIWNFAFVGAGYFFGDKVMTMIMG